MDSMMNIFQRIFLILGAIALIISIWTSPRIRIFPGGGIRQARDREAGVIDTRTATMRAVAVVGTTVLLLLKDFGQLHQ